MLIEQIPALDRNKLVKALDRNLRSISKTGISVTITAQAKECAVIVLNVTGLKGTASKQIILTYDAAMQQWIGYCDGYKYTLLSLSDVTLLCKNLTVKLSSLVSKF